VKRRLFRAFLALALLVSSVAAGLIAAPRLVEIDPPPGADPVPARSALRLTFSQPMRLDSVTDHLQIEPNLAGTFHWEGNSLVFIPDLPWPNESQVKVTLRRGARSAGFPGLPLLETTSWSFQVGHLQLAYLWPSDGPADLYALDVQSGDIQRLTQEARILDFSHNPSQPSIFFSADDGQSGSRIFQFHLAGPLAHQGPQLMIECPLATCRLAQVSPNGAWLAYERVPLEKSGGTARSTVWLFSMSQRASHLAGDENHTTSRPIWSPDGWLAFYDQQAQAFILLEPESRQRSVLPNQTGETGSWHPDSQVFVTSEVFIEAIGLLEPVTSSQLIRFELSENERRPVNTIDISQARDVEDSHPLFSPDGSRIIFSRRYLDLVRWTPGRQIWIMEADGSQGLALTREPAFNHYDFAWKPDGSQIAYVRSDPTQLLQPPELWLINADGSEPIQLVIGGYFPVWIP
jgi:Tol biopolymer transport system component